MHFLTVDSWYCFQLLLQRKERVVHSCLQHCNPEKPPHKVQSSLFQMAFFPAHRDLSVNPSPPGTDPVHPVGEDAAFSHFCVSWAEGEK